MFIKKCLKTKEYIKHREKKSYYTLLILSISASKMVHFQIGNGIRYDFSGVENGPFSNRKWQPFLNVGSKQPHRWVIWEPLIVCACRFPAIYY